MESQPIQFLDIGIDGIGFYAPMGRLRVEELALARGVDPAKYHNGLLLKEFAVPDYGEDAVSMAIMASIHALQKSKIDAHSIDAVFIGTETAAYAVKSIATILAGTLGISENAFTGDLSHACASATCSLINAIGLIQAGLINRALVVGTDVSKYPIKSPGEPTQGAGAVALIISKHPRIAQFSTKFGKISGHVNDFFRPNGQDSAIVYGQYSVDAYLAFQQRAYENLEEQIGEFHPNYWIFHSPYAKLSVKFFARLMLDRWMKHPEFIRDMVQSDDFSLESFGNDVLQGKRLIPLQSIHQLRKKGFTDEEICKINSAIDREMEARLSPSLAVSQNFGNIYSASVWAQIMAVLERSAHEQNILYFGSYGSGATAIAGLLKVQPGFREIIEAAPSLQDFIEEKKYISVIEYERLHKDRQFSNEIVTLGKIQNAGPFLEDQGISLAFCDSGCVLPHNRDLAYCPHGHFGRFNRFFPLLSQLDEIREARQVDPLWQLAHNGEAIILGNAVPGDFLELNFRKLREEDDKLLQWAPVYVKIPRRLKDSQHPGDLKQLIRLPEITSQIV